MKDSIPVNFMKSKPLYIYQGWWREDYLYPLTQTILLESDLPPSHKSLRNQIYTSDEFLFQDQGPSVWYSRTTVVGTFSPSPPLVLNLNNHIHIYCLQIGIKDNLFFIRLVYTLLRRVISIPPKIQYLPLVSLIVIVILYTFGQWVSKFLLRLLVLPSVFTQSHCNHRIQYHKTVEIFTFVINLEQSFVSRDTRDKKLSETLSDRKDSGDHLFMS